MQHRWLRIDWNECFRHQKMVDAINRLGWAAQQFYLGNSNGN